MRAYGPKAAISLALGVGGQGENYWAEVTKSVRFQQSDIDFHFESAHRTRNVYLFRCGVVLMLGQRRVCNAGPTLKQLFLAYRVC